MASPSRGASKVIPPLRAVCGTPARAQSRWFSRRRMKTPRLGEPPGATTRPGAATASGGDGPSHPSGDFAASRSLPMRPPCRRSPSTPGPSAPSRPSGCSGGPGSGRGAARRSALAAKGLAGRGRLARSARRRSTTSSARPPVVDGGAPIAPKRRLGPRPPLVARPDGAHLEPARRADDADLARLVRDLERDGREPEADAAAERALPDRSGSARSRGSRCA